MVKAGLAYLRGIWLLLSERGSDMLISYVIDNNNIEAIFNIISAESKFQLR